ncbi:hypothetical protein GH714_030691 [Hevea brasiliensis]|uniref:Uncharacterized protein n=1 Tax=Hevea brasiliensis TaxID=3981 RepID=A0A6A6N892_HEVBR|nr:hypothetical protein GH714_030691 [Hevea brasiliensis]
MGLNDSWNRLSSWHGTNCCQWSGIACDNTTGAVLAVDLPNLRSSAISGAIPPNLGNLSSLQFLDVSSFSSNVDNLEWVSGLVSLKYLNMYSVDLSKYIDLSLNNLTGSLPDSIGQLKNLVELRLNNNLLQGSIPSSIGNLQRLTTLTLASNKLNGTLPDSIGLLSELSSLDVSLNKLTGVISEAHFHSLGKLENISLSENSFILNVSSNWVPPFQVIALEMGSCHLGMSFPSWLKSQKQVHVLDFSGAGISGSIPNWFWDMTSSLAILNVSFNSLEGHIPNPFNIISYATVDLSFNQFKGPIPLPNVILLDLSNNQFSGSIPENIGQVMSVLSFLSLSGNKLTGAIPASIGEISLDVLDLSKNNLAGSIPSNIGNCSSLTVLDLQKTICPCSNDSNNGGDNYPDGGGKADQTDNGNGFIDKWFYMSIGVGFAAGLLLPYLVFAMKRSWGGVYFAFVDGTAYRLSSEKMKAAARRRNRGVR